MYLQRKKELAHLIQQDLDQIARDTISCFELRFQQYKDKEFITVESRKKALLDLQGPITSINDKKVTLADCRRKAAEENTIIQIEYPKFLKKLQKEVQELEHTEVTQKDKIDSLLVELLIKINELKQFPEIKKYGEALHEALILAEAEYFLNPTREAQKEFIRDCTILINNAKPVFQPTLGMGDYLGNLLKRIVNALKWCFGNNNFFPLTNPAATQAADKIEKELQNLNGDNLEDVLGLR